MGAMRAIAFLVAAASHLPARSQFGEGRWRLECPEKATPAFPPPGTDRTGVVSGGATGVTLATPAQLLLWHQLINALRRIGRPKAIAHPLVVVAIIVEVRKIGVGIAYRGIPDDLTVDGACIQGNSN